MEPSATLRAADVVLDDRVVLRGIDLEIGPGLTAVRGPNGAGKTTLLRALAGLVPLARGRRAVAGDLLFLGHRPQLHRALSAEQNLSFYSRYRGLPAPGIPQALLAWGVAEARRPVERLSAGQRRRVALARLDTERTPLVLLDEPFAELDDEAAALLAQRLSALARGGCAVLVATHGRSDLVADRTLQLADGALLQ